MRIKIVTTGLMIFGAILLLAMPLVIQMNPDVQAKKAQVSSSTVGSETGKPPVVTTRQRAEYAALFGIYVMSMLILWSVVLVLAMIHMRQVRKELLEETQANMQAFIEGTLADHSKKYSKAEQVLQKKDEKDGMDS